MGRPSLPNLSGIHVLVVEDHDDSREVWRRVLEHCGALVTTSRSAREAVQSSATLRPDVVVTDLAMPDEDGVWLAEQLRVRDQHLPIIAVTGYAEVFRPRLEAVFFRQVLLKPVDPWQLAEAIVAAVH